MRPFLFLGVRAEDAAADDEYAAMLHATGLGARDLVRIRVERAPLPALDPDAWSGVLLGGGPFCVSDPERDKSPVQRRVEADLAALLAVVLDARLPFFGCCYGIGVLGRTTGAVVDRTYGEQVGGVDVRLTADGLTDPVFGPSGPGFAAFVGHKEAVRELPPGAVLLATSGATPVQAFRVGRAYAAQFHPELDLTGLELRMRTYREHGYFAADELEAVLDRAASAGVVRMPTVLRRFVEVFARAL